MSEYDYEHCYERLLSRIDDKWDKRETSLIGMILSAAAFEFAQYYSIVEQVAANGFIETATYPWAKKRAAERDIVPYEATAAVMLGRFDKEIDAGTVFSVVGSELNYTSGAAVSGYSDGYYYYELTCTTTGSEGHDTVGDNLTPVEDISGLSVALIVGIITVGDDAENLTDFVARYKESIINQPFGGNVADYKEKMKTLDGVGKVKVVPMWSSGSKVYVYFTTTDLSTQDTAVPSAAEVAAVQAAMCPVPYEGLGLVPIGHDAVIRAVDAEEIAVRTTLDYADGYGFDDVSSEIQSLLEEYYAELNESFEDVDSITVRISQIESRILALDGIDDITDTYIGLSGGEMSAKNYTTANAYSLVFFGSFTDITAGREVSA